jgi:nucleoside-diphosphate-sugar epimerase
VAPIIEETSKVKLLVTGDLGYVGSVLVPLLLERGYEVAGFDIGFFADCSLSQTNENYERSFKDIRDVSALDLRGIDAIIHLAGISNDPSGELKPELTEQINLGATVRLGQLAKSVGVKRFIYASSQSMYGIASSSEELDEDLSEKFPLTTYARTKWEAEIALKELQSDGFSVVCFRPSTIFGVSPRLRCDIVFNNFIACAYTTGKIEMLSDGTPWRPVVHIRDVCSAFIAGLEAPLDLVSGRSYNVGIQNGNFSVRDLAEAAQRAVPGTELKFMGQHGGDSRTYKVSFKRILSELSEWYKPEWNLDSGGRELVEFFKAVNFNEDDFRGSKTNRLPKLKQYFAEIRK